VFLIGAGPGDPGLLTLRGRDILATSDLIVHPPSISPTMLQIGKTGTKRVEVRQRAGAAGIPTAAVRRHLIGPARRGRRVAVLLSGDPFLFGGGARIADLLHRAGIPHEVIPGIPATLAGPSYAGIPAAPAGSHGGVFLGIGGAPCSFAGRKGCGGFADAVEIHHISSRPGLGRSLQRLRRGAPASLPAAVIGHPTRSDQTVVESTLGRIGAAVRSSTVGFPAILILGPTVELRRRLQWFETRPLHGIRCVVTRSPEQAGPLGDELRGWGAEVIEMPMIDFGPPITWKPFDRLVGRLDRYDWVVFTSANGVRFALDRLLDVGVDARALGGVRLAAIGPRTAERLLARGLRADRIPASFLTEGLLRAFSRREVRGKRFLLARGNLASTELPQELRRRGAHVDNVVVYRTRRPTPARRVQWSRVLEEGVDLFTFTSSSTVNHFVESFGRRRALGSLRAARIGCIGPVTAATVTGFGLPDPIVAPVHTIPGLVTALLDHFADCDRSR
jgi:uroporphyrinogen III methyltransferase/synthase